MLEGLVRRLVVGRVEDAVLVAVRDDLFSATLRRVPTANAAGWIESEGSIGEVSARRVSDQYGPSVFAVGMRRDIERIKAACAVVVPTPGMTRHDVPLSTTPWMYCAPAERAFLSLKGISEHANGERQGRAADRKAPADPFLP